MARHRQRFAARLFLCAVELVFLIHDAGEYADVAALGHVVARVAGILERGVHAFEEQALLRVHPFRFARRDIKEQRVEAVDAVDKAAPLAVGLAWGVAVFVEVKRVIPAVGGDLGDAVSALA